MSCDVHGPDVGRKQTEKIQNDTVNLASQLNSGKSYSQAVSVYLNFNAVLIIMRVPAVISGFAKGERAVAFQNTFTAG